MTRNEPWIFAIIVVLSHSSFKGNSREWTQFVPSGTPSPPIAFYFKGYPVYPTPSHYDTPKSLSVHKYDEIDDPYGGASSPTVRPIVQHPKAVLQKQRLGGITQKFASAKTKINPKKFSRPIQPKIHRHSVERTNSTSPIQRFVTSKSKSHNETFAEMKSQVDHLGFLPPKINKSLPVHEFKKVVKNSRKTTPIPIPIPINSNAIDSIVDLPTRLQSWKDKNIHSNKTMKRPIDTNRKIPIDPKERNITVSRGFGSVEGSISEGSTDEISSDPDGPVLSPPPPPSLSIPAPALPRFDEQ
ncbi:unnamed protein product, partial [Mesorhabditis belari]|uniref:Uncharacterized protein n=1 Tax=Mesorhabditis belari TaxID=2138241 RepID=A0AAF3F2G9_9BILA